MTKSTPEAALALALKNDAWYQHLLCECSEAEVYYLRILTSLPETDQELLDSYISFCEELEYRRAFLESQL